MDDMGVARHVSSDSRQKGGGPPRTDVATADGAIPPTAEDRELHAWQASMTGSLSPIALTLAHLDWALHLANAPGRQAQLAREALRQWSRLLSPSTWCVPATDDHRFADAAWSKPPFDAMKQSFLLTEEWWRDAVRVPGVAERHADIVAFASRQILDAFAPSNFAMTNPVVLAASAASGGRNLVRGFENFEEDVRREKGGHPGDGASGFVVGVDLAVTPGKVVFRNALMELIQYAPTTTLVRPEPILLVPAWIMKYYILDLSPHDSLIRYLVGEGYTVFCVSWRNPGADLRDMSLDDYRRLGVMDALEAASKICGGVRVHGCGYCLGGTLLAVAAAAMGRDGDERLKTLTLLAAQTDFADPGQLRLFTDESQLALLDDVIVQRGYFDGDQMAGAFALLKSNDLIWARAIEAYLMGDRQKPNDLMAWSADTTRMPCRMHSEYLRDMYLHNDLAEGRVEVGGRVVDVASIKDPLFVVATETDHVAPWHSVYKINLLNDGEVAFVLTSGGHNAGIVSEPDHPHRRFRLACRAAGAPFVSPEEWMAANTPRMDRGGRGGCAGSMPAPGRRRRLLPWPGRREPTGLWRTPQGPMCLNADTGRSMMASTYEGRLGTRCTHSASGSAALALSARHPHAPFDLVQEGES
jgi:polyhydroxyalkanoate synthase